MLLRRTLENGTRFEPPCHFEISAAKRKQIMRVPVLTDFVKKTTCTAKLDCASTNQEWCKELAEKLGIKEVEGYSIYITRWGQTLSLNNTGGAREGKGMHLMDAISKLDAKAPQDTKDFTQISGQLSFRREFFSATYDPANDPVGTELTYHQLQTQIHDGLFLCDTDDEWNHMVAQMYYVERGDVMDEAELHTWTTLCLPPSALKGKQTAESRGPIIEKIHAKAEYCKKQWPKAKVMGEVVKFALAHWSSAQTFDANAPRVLSPNGSLQ